MKNKDWEFSANVSEYCHDHVYLSGREAASERRTWAVIILTSATMVLEIVSGLIFGSMALLADGWHMASHAAALGISAVAYAFSRRHAKDPRFSFGTGKVGELAGFTSAVLLVAIALLMGYESVKRFFVPVPIRFNEAIGVAVLGLAVNVASAMILKEREPGGGEHGHHHHADHNLKAAYLHVLADALTSLLAIVALVAGRFFGWVWMDPFMGIVGALVITRWSYQLMHQTGRVLLDMHPGTGLRAAIREALKDAGGAVVVDLHLWCIGMGRFAAIISLVAPDPATPDDYKKLLEPITQLCHVTVEVNQTGHATGP